jgi:chemotaxis protein histidine kinase CheA
MSLRGGHNSENTRVEVASFLVIRLGVNYFALPAAGVRGVLTQEEVGHDEAVTVSGTAYQLVDLSQRLSVVANSSGPERRTVLYSTGHSTGAIAVEQVVGLMEIERKDCLLLPSQFQRDERDWFRGMLLYQDQLVLILNVAWVLREPSGIVSIPIGQAEQLVKTTPAMVGGVC